ncbi:uncharacterized protein LOC111388135 [Olea europaea var. sylvestris]|uniref:uncharacterized protein LOC111388135 n=1 Tax=Olea europaea var. sylvestris TaxID=158386 RepID=UPI000C1CFC2D|nr:uncharacterized protein LOC111388135 [Olea europaea var. sylvestris]
MNTSMSSSLKLDKDEQGISVDIVKYRGMIGSLLYLTASRPDIMFSVCLCAHFQSNPKKLHLKAVKRIFHYLSGTRTLARWYPKGTHIDLINYSDADWAGCNVDRKSNSENCHFLGFALVSWSTHERFSHILRGLGMINETEWTDLPDHPVYTGHVYRMIRYHDLSYCITLCLSGRIRYP